MAKLAKKDAKAPPKAAKGVPVPAKPAAKVAPVKVNVAKAAPKPVAKAPVKTPAKVAPVVTKAKSAPAKEAPKPVAKAKPVAVKAPAPKAAPAKKPVPPAKAPAVAVKAAKSAPAKEIPMTAKAKPVAVKAPAPKAAPAKKAAPAAKAPAKATAPVKAAPAAKATKAAIVPPTKVAKGKAKAAAVEVEPVVVEAPKKGKKDKAAEAPESNLFQGGFFFEVAVGSAAVRKVKTTIVQNAPVSKKAAKDEETHDELLARIERDLQKARMVVRKPHRIMVCTKCCIMPVDDAFIVDRDTGYCTECALMLGLGHTREARHQNFHPSLMKGEEAEVEVEEEA